MRCARARGWVSRAAAALHCSPTSGRCVHARQRQQQAPAREASAASKHWPLDADAAPPSSLAPPPCVGCCMLQPMSAADPTAFVKSTAAPSRGALPTNFLTSSVSPMEYLQVWWCAFVCVCVLAGLVMWALGWSEWSEHTDRVSGLNTQTGQARPFTLPLRLCLCPCHPPPLCVSARHTSRCRWRPTLGSTCWWGTWPAARWRTSATATPGGHSCCSPATTVSGAWARVLVATTATAHYHHTPPPPPHTTTHHLLP
jgi:hypothetical protein